MSTLWFVVPAAGRENLTRICLRQLRRTCDALTAEGVESSAVVVADDGNLDTAAELGFATVRRNNTFLARKFNDGIQLACDPAHNPRPADYVVPFGSDDWVDHRLFLELPPPNTVLSFRQAAFVDEHGRKIASRHLEYPGGVGIRVYPRQVMARLKYRPGDEDRRRGCDTSILINLQRTYRTDLPNITYRYLHDYQIVDWKTGGDQLNPYRSIILRHRRGTLAADPFKALAGLYPAEALTEMRDHYQTKAAA